MWMDASVDLVAVTNEGELREGEGVPDAAHQLAGGVPVSVREDRREQLALGQGGGRGSRHGN